MTFFLGEWVDVSYRVRGSERNQKEPPGAASTAAILAHALRSSSMAVPSYRVL